MISPNTFLHKYDNQFIHAVGFIPMEKPFFPVYFLDAHQALGDPFSKACSSSMYSDTKGLNSIKWDSGSEILPTGLTRLQNFMYIGFAQKQGWIIQERATFFSWMISSVVAQLQVFAAWWEEVKNNGSDVCRVHAESAEIYNCWENHKQFIWGVLWDLQVLVVVSRFHVPPQMPPLPKPSFVP